MQLEPGQVVVITGGASGIGYGMAQAFAARGLSLVLADVEGGALEVAADRLRGEGASVEWVVTDVSKGEQVHHLADRTIEAFGRVDVVCNNAGVNTRSKAAWEYDEVDWEWLIGVNIWGVVHGIRAFVPRLIEQGHGHVVNTGSTLGVVYDPMSAPYAATKHSVLAITEALAAELRDRETGVGVTILLPSYIPTNFKNAERNRPDNLKRSDGPAVGKDFLRTHIAPVEPGDVGTMVVEAVERDQLHVTTHPGLAERLRTSIAPLLADVDF